TTGVADSRGTSAPTHIRTTRQHGTREQTRSTIDRPWGPQEGKRALTGVEYFRRAQHFRAVDTADGIQPPAHRCETETCARCPLVEQHISTSVALTDANAC